MNILYLISSQITCKEGTLFTPCIFDAKTLRKLCSIFLRVFGWNIHLEFPWEHKIVFKMPVGMYDFVVCGAKASYWTDFVKPSPKASLL